MVTRQCGYDGRQLDDVGRGRRRRWCCEKCRDQARRFERRHGHVVEMVLAALAGERREEPGFEVVRRLVSSAGVRP